VKKLDPGRHRRRTLGGIAAAAAAIVVVVSPGPVGTAHADAYDEMGPTICMAFRHGQTGTQLVAEMMDATRRDPGPKGPLTHDQAMELLTVMVNAYCPDQLLWSRVAGERLAMSYEMIPARFPLGRARPAGTPSAANLLPRTSGEKRLHRRQPMIVS